MTKYLRKDYEAELLKYHGQGFSNRAIAEKIGAPRERVARWLNDLGLSANGRTRGVREVDGDLSKCSVCGEWKLTETFPKNRVNTTTWGYLTYCGDCRTGQIRDNLNANFQANMGERMRRVRNRCQKFGIKCDIDKEYLIDVWEAQEGKCFYTDTELSYLMGKGRAENTGLSIDRVDCTKGYVHGNVVLTTLRVNSMKRDATLEEMKEWMPGWYERIVNKFDW